MPCLIWLQIVKNSWLGGNQINFRTQILFKGKELIWKRMNTDVGERFVYLLNKHARHIPHFAHHALICDESYCRIAWSHVRNIFFFQPLSRVPATYYATKKLIPGNILRWYSERVPPQKSSKPNRISGWFAFYTLDFLILLSYCC